MCNMKKIYLSLLFLVTIVLVSFTALCGRTFEGSISLIRETVYDTTYISIFVKNAMVRVDERDTKHRLVSSHIVNIDKEEVFALSFSKQLYAKLSVNSPYKNNPSQTISKTPNHKQINGKTCYQWRVRDEQMNTEVAYWMYESEFDFFAKLLHLLRRTEYSLSVLSAIPDAEGYLPMLAEERTLLRKEKLKVRVVSIEQNTQSNRLFTIPSHFKSANRPT